jgi:hypothetical protein
LTNIFVSYKNQNVNDEKKIWKNNFEWHGTPSIREYSFSDTVAYFYSYIYENNEKEATLFVEKEFPSS